MNKTTTAVIIVILLALGVWLLVSKNTAHAPATTTPTGESSNTTGGELFSDSPLAPYAYLISTATYDAKTQMALRGFSVTKNNLPDGSMQITLNAKNPEYHTQIYTVKPGEKLYFIERSLGDDNGVDDRTLADDTAIL